MKFQSQTMNINFKNAVGYLTFKNLEKFSFLKHCFSTRLGGVSRGQFKSMNLSYSQGDIAENVEENYKIFCEALDFNMEKLVLTSQIHGSKIKCIYENDIKSGTLNSRKFSGIDGLITDIKGVTLATFHADCPAIFMVDSVKKVVGLAHAGWKGTVQEIAKKLVEKFVLEYGSSPSDLICSLGPAIGQCCFEVSTDILPEFEKLGLPKTYLKRYDKNSDKANIDLLEVNKQILLKEGVLKENIVKSDVCTKCNHDLLFSHRATNGKRGGSAAFISIV
ncbi:MAG: peptidoglycan editing factor PgeF [Clostridia bacterium]|nr:peptidoglycan editing factor PgeF [Clostridia bacterium]